jgi:hypothetical protein
MTREDRDAWLDAVLAAHPTGMHFRTAYIISRALLRGEGSTLSLMRIEREHGEAARRSMQRAIRWLEYRGLLRVEPGAHVAAPRKYTILLPEPGRAAA